MFNGLRRFSILFLLLLLVPALAACSDGDGDKESSNNNRDNVASASDVEAADETLRGVTVVQEPSINIDAPIPVPANEDDIILTISGKIDPERANADGKIVMDLAALESVGVYRYNIAEGDDPFTELPMVYEGVLLRDLLKVWGVPDDAKTLKITALDRYQVEVPISDFLDFPVLLALKENGEYMSIERHGPAMFVYPYSDYEFDLNIYGAYWAYQVAEIEVK